MCIVSTGLHDVMQYTIYTIEKPFHGNFQGNKVKLHAMKKP